MQVFRSAEEFRNTHNGSVVTIGKYDGIHLGHQAIISELVRQAEALGLPSVVVLSEPQPEEFFRGNNAPVRLMRFTDKVSQLEKLGVDSVFCLEFNEITSSTPAEAFISDFLMESLGAKAVVVGHDFCFGEGRTGNVDLLKTFGKQGDFRVTEMPALEMQEQTVSSTRVREYLKQGDCQSVITMLGRPWSVSGTVVEGRKLGRTLGFPTANISLEFDSMPVSGVFAVCVKHSMGITRGVANIGVRPTVDNTSKPHLEVHLFSVNRDLYGQPLEVMFMHKLRNEKKFDSVEALQSQINRDAEQAKAWFWKGEAEVV